MNESDSASHYTQLRKNSSQHVQKYHTPLQLLSPFECWCFSQLLLLTAYMTLLKLFLTPHICQHHCVKQEWNTPQEVRRCDSSGHNCREITSKYVAACNQLTACSHVQWTSSRSNPNHITKNSFLKIITLKCPFQSQELSLSDLFLPFRLHG